MKKYYLSIILFSWLLGIATVHGQEVTFVSPQIEDAVRQHIPLTDLEQICFAQLDTITTLNLSRRGITDIHDIMLMPKLRMIDLSDNLVDDLQPLSVLDSLEWVDLSFNNLTSINPLFYSSAKELTINVAFNHIVDFSLFGSISLCSFNLEGTGLQQSEDVPFLDVPYFYSEINNQGKLVVTYCGYTNVSSGWIIQCGSTNIPAQLDGNTHTEELTGISAETTALILTNGEVNETTYAVPCSFYKAEPNEVLTFETGLPDNYNIEYAGALYGTVTVEGTTITYTAPDEVTPDIISFNYNEGSQLRGYGRLYTGLQFGDVNADGSVNFTDAVGIVNRILGNPSGNFIERAADVNRDSKVTITDAVSIVNMILMQGQ